MDLHTYDFNYDPYTPKIDITATISDNSDFATATFDIPFNETLRDRRIAISLSSPGTARVPYAIDKFSRGETLVIPGDVCLAGPSSTQEQFENATDEEITTSFQNFRNSEDGFGVTRNTYLTSSCTGTILLDIQHPLSLLTQTDAVPTWFVEGLIRRVDLLKAILPLSKVGIIGFGQPHPLGEPTDNSHRNAQLSAAEQGLIGAVDFMSPALFQERDRASDQWAKIYKGDRSQQAKSICDQINQLNFTNKSITPVMKFEYKAGANAGQNADEINRSEILFSGCTDFIFVEDSFANLTQMPEKRVNLLRTIYEVTSGAEGIMMSDTKFQRGTRFKTDGSSRDYRDWPNGPILELVYNNRKTDIWSDLNPCFILFGTSGDPFIDPSVQIDGGPVINFNESSSQSSLLGLSPENYARYVNTYADRVITYIEQYLVQSKLKIAKNPNSIVIVDIEHDLFDTKFFYEVAGWGIRNGMGIPVPSGSSGILPMSIYFDRVDPADSLGAHTPNFRFDIMQEAIVRVVNATKALVGHNRVAMYRGPVAPFHNDIWQLLDPSKGNLSSVHLQNAIEYAWQSPELKPLVDAVGYNCMAWWPATFAHKKFLWDSIVSSFFNVVGDQNLIVFGMQYQLNSTSAGSISNFTETGWGDLPSQYRGLGEYTTAGNEVSAGAFPIAGGVIQYMAESLNLVGMKGIIFPDFGFNAALVNQTDLRADVLNNSIGAVQSHTYSEDQTDVENNRKDKKFFYNWYYNKQWRGLMKSSLDLRYVTSETGYFDPDRRPYSQQSWSANGPVERWKLNNRSGNTPPAWKTNPNATDPDQDYILWWRENVGERLYELGFRRMSIRDPNGDRPGTQQRGFGVPSCSWTNGEPFAGHVFTDAENYFSAKDNLSEPGPDNGGIGPHSPPFYSEEEVDGDGNFTGGTAGTLQDRSLSWKNFIKPWLDEKKAAGDPIDFYIYDAYQVVLFGDENGVLDRDTETQIAVPASGNLALRIYNEDSVWMDANPPRFDLLQPIPDFSDLDHVNMKESEALAWRDQIGVKGMIADKASGAAGSDKPPGYFDFYYNRGMYISGEAVPMRYDLPGPPVNYDMITTAPYMGYYTGPNDNGGNFWGRSVNSAGESDPDLADKRRWEFSQLDEGTSEIHVVATWGFNGGGGPGTGNGFNSDYVTNIDAQGADYDMVAMKNHIDDIIDRGYVFSTTLQPYKNPSPIKENSAREEIIRYVASVQGTGGRSDIPEEISCLVYTNPQAVRFIDVSPDLRNDDLRINTMVSGDGRGLLGKPGWRNGPNDDTIEGGNSFVDPTADGRYSIAEPPQTVEEHARLTALGIIARIIKQGNPEKPCIFLYGYGSNTLAECSYWDEVDWENGLGIFDTGELNAWFSDTTSGPRPDIYRSITYTQVRSDYNLESPASAFHASPVGPRLYFHEDDALEEGYEFAGNFIRTHYKQSHTNWVDKGQGHGQNVRDDLVDNWGVDSSLTTDDVTLKMPVSPFRAHTPWMRNGIEHSKRWVNAFCEAYKEEQEFWANHSSPIIINDPHRIQINTDPGYSPQIYQMKPYVDFALMKKDPRFTTEIVPGWGRTLQELQNETPFAALNLAQEATDRDGVGQQISCGTWDWIRDSNPNFIIGEKFQATESNQVPGIDNFKIPYPQGNDGGWEPHNALNDWWTENMAQVPFSGDRRRYEMVLFERWFHSILSTAKSAANWEGIAEPFRKHFRNVGFTDYNDLTADEPFYRDNMNQKFITLGSGRTDADDTEVFKYDLLNANHISTPLLYKVPHPDWKDKGGNTIIDDFERRLTYWSEKFDTMFNTDMNQTLIGTDISPYDPQGTLRFTPSPRNFMPWVLGPTSTPGSSNPFDTNETVAELLSMLSEKGIKEVIIWSGRDKLPHRPDDPDPNGNIFDAMDLLINGDGEVIDEPGPGSDRPGTGGGGGGPGTIGL